MVDSSQLKEAIQSELDKGKTPDEIRDVMWKAGFTRADIDNVFEEMGLKKEQSKAPSEFYDKKRKESVNKSTDPIPSAAIGAIVMLFIIAGIGLFASIFLIIVLQTYSDSMVGLLMILAWVQIFMGILYLIAAIAMLMKKGWGKKMALALVVLGLIFSFTNLDAMSIISIAIYALLVYLLTRPSVKDYYG